MTDQAIPQPTPKRRGRPAAPPAPEYPTLTPVAHRQALEDLRHQKRTLAAVDAMEPIDAASYTHWAAQFYWAAQHLRPAVEAITATTPDGTLLTVTTHRVQISRRREVAIKAAVAVIGPTAVERLLALTTSTLRQIRAGSTRGAKARANDRATGTH